MTRIARAEGSKASNKRTLEEATPWKVMQHQRYNRPRPIEAKSRNKLNCEFKQQVVSHSKTSKSLPETSGENTVKGTIKKSKTVNELANKRKEKGNTKEEYIIEDGIKYKIFKKKGKKPWFDLPYVENDVMCRYKNFYIKREMVQVLDEYKKSLEEKSLDKKQIANKMLHKERKAHRTLRLELLRDQLKSAKTSDKSVKFSKSLNRTLRREKILESKETCDNKGTSDSEKHQKKNTNQTYDINFEENDVMTCYEGYWILKDNATSLDSIRNIKIARIIKERRSNKEDLQLSPEEDLLLRRLMKKEKRREHKILLLKLREGAKYKNRPKLQSGPKRPGRYLGIEYKVENGMEKFDGFWIKKDGAERLKILREKLKEKNCADEEIESIIKKERRKEERILKNEKKLFCFQCRQVGHMVSSCPDATDQDGIQICFKCGSTEHMARKCPSNQEGSSYSHATCFICGEVGHISRECPDNPRGLYPEGGGCRECGSVEHLKRDCPELQKQNEETVVKLTTYDSKRSADSIEYEDSSAAPVKKKRKIKSVVF